MLSCPNSDCHCKVSKQLRTCDTEAVSESRESTEVQTDSTEETENDFADFYHHFCPDKADKEISSALKGKAQHLG